MTEVLAKAILIPYLWWHGYAMDEESIAQCRYVIESRESEDWQWKKIRLQETGR